MRGAIGRRRNIAVDAPSAAHPRLLHLLVHLLRFIMALHAGRFAFSWWVYWRWWRFIEEAEDTAGGGLANATAAALASAGRDYALWAVSREAI